MTHPPEFLEIPGCRIAYRSAGHGEPLLFVHGSLIGMDTFRRQLAEFGSVFRAVTYARRFHPPSCTDSPGGVYDMSQQAEDLHQVIRALGFDRPHLVTSSFGGYIALRLLLDRPGAARSLVLAEPPMLRLLGLTERGRSAFEEFRRGALDPAKSAFLAGRLEEGTAAFFDGIRGEAGAFGRLGPRLHAELMKFAPSLSLELTSPLDVYMPEIGPSDLRRVDIPVLLLTAGRSPQFFHLVADVLEDNIPRVKRVEVAEADHSVHTSQAKRYNAEVMAFLAEGEQIGEEIG